MILRTPGREFRFPRRPLVMGIVNINDDSFCGDGTLDPGAAIAQAKQALADGADIIDIGAESARTNRQAISVDEEARRLESFLLQWPEFLRSLPQPLGDGEQVWPPLLSINSWRPEVAARILPLGGDILNDLSALPTGANAEICARHGAALLIMHSVGEPKVPHFHVGYEDVMRDLITFFREKIALAQGAGLSPEQIILDPGIDFAKQRDDNLRIFAQVDRFQEFRRPILLPVSRKTVIGEVLKLPNPQDRDPGTLACVAAGLRRGVAIFRVHHVKAAAQAIKLLWRIQEPS